MKMKKFIMSELDGGSDMPDFSPPNGSGTIVIKSDTNPRPAKVNISSFLYHLDSVILPGLCSTHQPSRKFDSTLTQMSRV